MSVDAIVWTFRHSRSTGLDRLVLLTLADHYNDEEKAAWPSIGTISRKAGISESSVKRCIVSLSEIGEIQIEERKKSNHTNSSNLYHFPAFEEWSTRDREGVRENPRGSNRTPPQVTENPGEGVTENRELLSTSNPLKEPAREPPSDYHPFKGDGKPCPKPVKKEKVRKGFGNTTRPVYEPKAPPRKAPAEWQWFASLYHRSTDKIPVSCPKYWDALEVMLKEISQTEAERLFSLWLDQVDRLTAWTGLNFLESEWKLVWGMEQEGGSSAMPTLKGWDE